MRAAPLRPIPLQGAIEPRKVRNGATGGSGIRRGHIRGKMKVLGPLDGNTGQKRLSCVFHRTGVFFLSPFRPHRVGLTPDAEIKLQGVWTDALWRQKLPGPWVLEGAPPSHPGHVFENLRDGDGGVASLRLVLRASFELAGDWWEVGCWHRSLGALPPGSRCHDQLVSVP